jgi:hypothetical protein
MRANHWREICRNGLQEGRQARQGTVRTEGRDWYETCLQAADKRVELSDPGAGPGEETTFMACGQPSQPGKITGELASPTKLRDVVITTGVCEVGCAGAKGEMSFQRLEGHLGWIDKEKGEVGLDLSPEKTAPEQEPLLADFACAGGPPPNDLRGSFVVGWTGNVGQTGAKGEWEFGLHESLEGGETDVPLNYVFKEGVLVSGTPITINKFTVSNVVLPKGVEIKP